MDEGIKMQSRWQITVSRTLLLTATPLHNHRASLDTKQLTLLINQERDDFLLSILFPIFHPAGQDRKAIHHLTPFCKFDTG